MLNKVKLSLRISGDMFDSEIQDLIEAALTDEDQLEEFLLENIKL
jgi:hypothetical protein